MKLDFWHFWVTGNAKKLPKVTGSGPIVEGTSDFDSGWRKTLEMIPHTAILDKVRFSAFLVTENAEKVTGSGRKMVES